MADLLLFAEDDAQEKFVGALIQRLAGELQLTVRLRVRSSRGGFGMVLQELGRFSLVCERRAEASPDVVVVAVDANCKGLKDRYDQVEGRVGDILRNRLVVAVADPHIERWFLVDGAAFRSVLGHGCQAPDQKCEKGRYKGLLIKAVRDAGVEPLLGGIEYAEDIAKLIDLKRAGAADPALRRFVSTLRTKLNQLKT
jgi:Domain of unknown function (DUF4276)